MLTVYFPVCCTANISAKILTKLFETANQDDDDEGQLVLVRDRTGKHSGPSTPPIDSPISSSPFQGLTDPGAVYKNLSEIYDATNSDALEVVTNNFTVVDERSTQDSTILLVTPSETEDDKLESVRASFERAGDIALFWLGEIGIQEVQDAAVGEDDGVYR